MKKVVKLRSKSVKEHKNQVVIVVKLEKGVVSSSSKW